LYINVNKVGLMLAVIGLPAVKNLKLAPLRPKIFKRLALEDNGEQSQCLLVSREPDVALLARAVEIAPTIVPELVAR
jgi:hypothetical protein